MTITDYCKIPRSQRFEAFYRGQWVTVVHSSNTAHPHRRLCKLFPDPNKPYTGKQIMVRETAQIYGDLEESVRYAFQPSTPTADRDASISHGK
jgi:hypothetical protein